MDVKQESPLPTQNLPKSKNYIYLFLIFLTAGLLYLYSYPLEVNSNIFVIQSNDLGVVSDTLSSNEDSSVIVTTFLKTESESHTITDKRSEFKSEFAEIVDSKSSPIINALKEISELNPSPSENELTKLSEFTEISIDELTEFSATKLLKETDSSSSSSILINEITKINEKSVEPRSETLRPNYETAKEKKSTEATNDESLIISTESTVSVISTDSTIQTTKKDSTLIKSVASFSTNVTETENGFLVFSKNCKIPDIDPMHPSIQDLVSFSPPLNCTKGEPITKTEGSFLILDMEAAERRGFQNFTCCYRYIKRGKDGASDDKIKYGKCRKFSEKTKIDDEFITVTCENSDHYQIYKEFHSFVQDKPSVEKRCEMQNPSPYSVLIVGIDSVSRLNMHRQMNRTVRYLVDNMKAIEMLGFNKIGDNTFPNLGAMLLGYDERELPEVCWSSDPYEPLDKCNFLWKRYAEKGHRTFFAEDTPHISTFNYVKKGFFKQPTDYYFRHFILSYEDTLGWKKKFNCHRCVGGISETEAVLHWTEQFATHFKDRAYFSLSWINSMTHDYLDTGSAVDYLYEKFLRTLHESGALDKTIVVVMADHGMRWGEIRTTFIGRLEERLPMLFMFLPPDFQKNYPQETKSLRTNAHRLVTPFDLHATLLNILHLKEDWSFSNPDNVSEGLTQTFMKRAQSLFREVPEDRSCEDASIEEHWCTCESALTIDTDDENVQKVSGFLVEYINNLLRPVSSICATLNLTLISDARILSPGTEHEGHSSYDNIYTLILRTSPGGAIFEGTVRISPPDYECELLGTISRLNLYGDQSVCVNDAILKKYCFCT